MLMEKKDLDRFWQKVDKRSPDECWEWQANRTRQGYGVFWLNGKNRRANRVAYAIAHGPVPDGFVVRHKCDNPRCCNPYHLEAGSQKDNVADMVIRGRRALTIGESNGCAKLTDDNIREIRRDQRRQAQIAADHNATQSLVSLIKNGKIWMHIS